MMYLTRSGARPLSLLALAALLAACGGNDDGNGYSAEIRRTEMGVPHIKASNWSGVGFGYGYVQAEDNLCTMADSFLTFRGERSQYFGGEATLVYGGTIGRPRNIDSDFFHRHILSADVVDAMAAAQSDNMHKLVEGFAAGYNRYVKDVKTGAKAHAACRTESWVQPITAQDIWRRMYAANLAGGYSNFVANIANAQPPVPANMSAQGNAAQSVDTKLAAFDPAATRTPRLEVGGTEGIGSNMYGFGAAATGEGSGVLFGNPHWYWKGPDRFYQAQLTIPGELDVSGVSFLGIPVVLIGFNDSVAWSHTVSTARRFGFFQRRQNLAGMGQVILARIGQRDRPRGAVEQRRLVVGIFKAVARLQHRAVDGILRLGKVHVAGGDAEQARQVAERLQREVQRLQFANDGESFGVTISQGITMLGEGDVLDDLYARADAAMYQAKRQGKDCIVLG